MGRLYKEEDRGVEGLQRAFEDLRADMNRHFNRLYLISGVSWITVVGLSIGLYFK